MNRGEHLAWAKRRPLEYIERADTVSAIASMMSDLRKHPELENHIGIYLAFTVKTLAQVKHWIEGFA